MQQPAQAGTAAPPPLALFIAHARPRLLPWMLGIVLFGWGFAHWDQQLYLTRPARLALLLVAWSLGHAGTLWLNAGLDREEDAAVFARPWPVPHGIARAGYLALALSVVVAAAAEARAAICVALCALLAIAYSHPRLAWKGHPLGGPLVNVAGYGVLSPLAGSLVASQVVTSRLALTLALWSLWLFGAYLAAQAFQAEDDRRRGYRTLVVTHGPATTLVVARWAMNAAILGALALTVAGLYPRLTLLVYPWFWVADRHMRRWQGAPAGGGPEYAVGLFQRMLLGGLAIFVLAWVDYWFL